MIGHYHEGRIISQWLEEEEGEEEEDDWCS